MTPAKIGTYEILGDLRPGLRPLYKAKAADGRIVALKTISTDGIADDVRERFKREGEISRLLDHPNIVRVYESGEADGVLYLAMELLEGCDLRKVIAENRAPSWEQKLSIMEQVSEGLAFAHSKNLVHRDIKPANLFLEDSGRVRILDFGMARVQASNLTMAGMAVGTLLYMAPEQVRGEPCTAAADIFAAGIIFYELASGKHPLAAGERDIAKILQGIMFGVPTPMGELVTGAPDGLDIIITRALQKDPAKRLQSAADLKRALGFCAIGLTSGPAVATPAAAGAPKPVDLEKTTVMPVRPRSAPAAPAAPAPAAQPKSTPPKAPFIAPQQPKAIFCPTCTTPNPKDAVVCEKCGTPLSARRAKTVEPSGLTLSWKAVAVIGSICVAILLAVFVWLLKFR
jgi:serine/threonine-protein kinase